MAKRISTDTAPKKRGRPPKVKSGSVKNHKSKNRFQRQKSSSDDSSKRKLADGPIGDKNRKGFSADNPARIYCDGVFDMYHIGHARVLEQAKKLLPHVHLIAGVTSDKDTIEKKGKVVMNEKERCDIISHCKWVDEVLFPAPWSYGLDFLERNNIDYVAHDDLPYAAVQKNAASNPEPDDVYAEIKAAGKFLATQRTEGISTSDIILRIIQDYDMYVVRQVARGYKANQIGISKTKLMRIKIMNKFKDFVQEFEKDHLAEGTKFDTKFQTIRKRLYRFLGRLEKSKQKRSFLESFGDRFHSSTTTKNVVQYASDDDEPMSDFDF